MEYAGPGSRDMWYEVTWGKESRGMQNTKSGGRRLCGKRGSKVPGCGKQGV